jgi:hypothetical protein
MALKRTSANVAISFGLAETVVGTFAQEEIPLTLSPLDLEVFVVLAVDLQPSAPDVIAGQRTVSRATVTKSSQASYQAIDNSNVIATARRDAVTDVASGVAAFEHNSQDTPNTTLDFVDIISTNNFFIGIQGQSNTLTMGLTGRLYGYRAKADAATYAALVQSEILSQ